MEIGETNNVAIKNRTRAIVHRKLHYSIEDDDDEDELVVGSSGASLWQREQVSVQRQRQQQQQRRQSQTPVSCLPDKTAHFFYTLAILCSTYSLTILSVSIILIVSCCISEYSTRSIQESQINKSNNKINSYPLINLPLPGSEPKFLINATTSTGSGNGGGRLSDPLQPQQPSTAAFCYVQQIVLRASVHPWLPATMQLRDAFRAPLYEVFRLLDLIQNYQHPNKNKHLGHLCFQVDEVKSNYESIFPQFSCLLLSPANLWQQDIYKFNDDSNLLSTILKQENLQRGKISVAQMIFGMNLKQTGIKRYPLRNRQRIIQYAITLFFKELDQDFIDGLREKLIKYYPLHQQSASSNRNSSLPSSTAKTTATIYYPNEVNYWDLIPLILTFPLLVLYVYYWFRKIDAIRSKFAMSVIAIVSIYASLVMSLGICFFFGLQLSTSASVSLARHSNDFFPYLVIIVGLENVMILTKSVDSIPVHLDSKIRLAQGISKEGWSITKNFLIELTILTFGLLTFISKIQEFCIFTIVGLVCDFILQLFFYSTLLSIDIKYQKDVTSITKNENIFFFVQNATKKSSNYYQMLRPKKPQSVAGGGGSSQPTTPKKLPKRLRLLHLWTRTRFFQRAFMIWTIVWISLIVIDDILIPTSSSSRLQKRHNLTPAATTSTSATIATNGNSSTKFSFSSSPVNYVTEKPPRATTSTSSSSQSTNTESLDQLKARLKYHPRFENWQQLSFGHWPAIFRAYNMTLYGQQVVLLPNIRLAHVIAADQAVQRRNPNERFFKQFRWDALAAALDPLDFIDRDVIDHDESSLKYHSQLFDKPYYPSSPMELFLISVLCVISLIVLGYTLVVLYRCLCSRNYAEWRTSTTRSDSGRSWLGWMASWLWSSGLNQTIGNGGVNDSNLNETTDTQLIVEAVPSILSGHNQEIEFLLTNSSIIISTCLLGEIRIWDVQTGDLIKTIEREQIYLSSSGRTLNRNGQTTNSNNKCPSTTTFGNDNQNNHNTNNCQVLLGEETSGNQTESQNDYFSNNREPIPAIWCIDFCENLLVIGCSDGRLEVWNIDQGCLETICLDESRIGITSIKIIKNGNLSVRTVITARIEGLLDFYRIEIADADADGINTQCLKMRTIRAHRQPITCVAYEGNRIVTGSRDHTLRVFRLDTARLLYTLHGHCGPISCLFIDRYSPMQCGSASQDGLLSVWDLLTGTCIFSVQAHDGNVVALDYSISLVISLGVDDRLCVWERFQGHLLNTIYLNHCFTRSILMLSHHLIMTARYGRLMILDARTGSTIRVIKLGNRDNSVFVKRLFLLENIIVCDYGTELRIIRFPLICNKND